MNNGANASSPDAPALVEAVLLVSARPVSSEALRAATGLSEGDLTSAISALEHRYSPQTSGIVLRRVAGGYQLSTNPSCAVAVERFRKEEKPAPLSNAAHEVLSCVLYLGPLTRGAISSVRGVNSDAVVRGLLERELLAESGADSHSPGSPALLDVTRELLAAAGAASRDDFPPLEELVGEEEISRVRERISSGTDSHPRPES